jgi:hypothetical protein
MLTTVNQSQGISHTSFFHSITDNIMLDELNKDYCKVIGEGWFHPNVTGIGGTGGDEFTFTKRMWIPHKKTYKFGPVDGTTKDNQHDLYFSVLCYDAFGSVITDNIAYFQAFSELQYKDP